MIHFRTGNLLESDAEALVNTVNTVGVMGKGIALQFKEKFPENYRRYLEAYKKGDLKIGELLVVEEETLLSGKKTIINFPTKTTWRKPSEYQYIEAGLEALAKLLESREIRSVAIPPLGSGNGGLDWFRVRSMIERRLGAFNEIDISVYEPNAAVREVLNKERVKLTPARAMLLTVLFDLVKSGEFVSEFAAEKIAYFLQRFGGAEVFKLGFEPKFYGPYSGKVRHILHQLNGSYVTGYSAKDKKPFEEIAIIPESEELVNRYLDRPENAENLRIVERTKVFLAGFYSPFSLELLSTVDFIFSQGKVSTAKAVLPELEKWSNRKKTLFNNPRFVSIATDHIREHLYYEID